MKMPVGDNYEAKLGAKDYPYKDNPGVTTVSLKRIDANTIEETDTRDGKPIMINRMKVSEDGKTMSLESQDLLQRTTTKIDAKKQ